MVLLERRTNEHENRISRAQSDFRTGGVRTIDNGIWGYGMASVRGYSAFFVHRFGSSDSEEDCSILSGGIQSWN